MKQRPKVSVVLPAYNPGAHLREAVDSILRQSERDFELILINDGSTDGTDEVCRDLASSDDRIVYVRQENRGIVTTLNLGLELARGEFIARMDADDVAHPSRLALQLDLLAKSSNVVVCGTGATIFGERTGVMRLPRSDRACRAMLFFMPCFAHPTVMFRRRLVDLGIRYKQEFQYIEDYGFWLEASKHGGLANIAKSLLCYRTHPSQITSSRRLDQKSMQAALSSEVFAQAGIELSADEVRSVIWPGDSQDGRLRIFCRASAILIRLMLRGHFSAVLSMRLLRNVARRWSR